MAVDGEDNGRVRAGHESASVGVECAAGDWQSATASPWPWTHRHS